MQYVVTDMVCSGVTSRADALSVGLTAGRVCPFLTYFQEGLKQLLHFWVMVPF